MNTKGIDVKERLQAIIDECDPMSDYLIGTNLQALLADLDAAELRKCPKCGNEDEPLQACDHCGHTWYTTSKLDRGIERAESPKPTGEQLKGSCTVESSTCPDPQPAQMICNHAGECKERKKGKYCSRKTPHNKQVMHQKGTAYCMPGDCPFPLAVCVPWVEPVKESDELPKDMFPIRNPGGHTYCERLWCKFRMQKETPKEPEPAAPPSCCANCGQKLPCAVIARADPDNTRCMNWTSKEPKAEPGLVSYPIIGGKGNELWLVQRPAGAIALYKVVGRKDFAYIETEIGDKFISLQAFDDPPKKCWFRETK